LFQGCESCGRSIVVDRLPFPVGICSQSQGPVINESAASEGARKKMLLLLGWVESICVSYLHKSYPNLVRLLCQEKSTKGGGDSSAS
jgi:hypothetical protein